MKERGRNRVRGRVRGKVHILNLKFYPLKAFQVGGIFKFFSRSEDEFLQSLLLSVNFCRGVGCSFSLGYNLGYNKNILRRESLTTCWPLVIFVP